MLWRVISRLQCFRMAQQPSAGLNTYTAVLPPTQKSAFCLVSKHKDQSMHCLASTSRNSPSSDCRYGTVPIPWSSAATLGDFSLSWIARPGKRCANIFWKNLCLTAQKNAYNARMNVTFYQYRQSDPQQGDKFRIFWHP